MKQETGILSPVIQPTVLNAEPIGPTQALTHMVSHVGWTQQQLSGTQQETTRGPLHNQLHLRVRVTCMAVKHSFLWDCFFSREKFYWKQFTVRSVDYPEQPGHCIQKDRLLLSFSCISFVYCDGRRNWWIVTTRGKWENTLLFFLFGRTLKRSIHLYHKQISWSLAM